MAVKKPDFYTIEEYSILEDSAEGKHEFEGGNIFARSGETINHGMLCGNIYNELRSGLNDNSGIVK